MVEIKEQTLLMAIQVMADAIAELKTECAETDGPDLPDLQELLLSYSLAAADLKRAYLGLQEAGAILPPYEELVANRVA